jgi:hypothetical protein
MPAQSPHPRPKSIYPIGWQNTLSDITIDVAKPPICGSADKSVFDRIEMNVINMLDKIAFITNLMLTQGI